ncbi:MAG TPA: zinc-binding dehydrogenase [Kofleriaceae bacterium]|nr:zinc-binding dehydrogenase [Kofleriaceae bacterium]
MILPSDRYALQLISLVTAAGDLELSLAPVAIPSPGPDEVVIRIEAAPINPSDLILLLAGVDPRTLTTSGPADRPVVRGKLRSVERLAARVGVPMAVGNEGAGTVIEAGASPEAQALRDKVVAVATGSGMYAQYRVVRAAQCLPLGDGARAIDGASAVINPQTALGFLETMRRQGHRALANTAAASNLGQMLIRLCVADGIPLVNVVRRAEQVAALRAIGATHVCVSSSPTFTAELTDAFAETGATIAFDAVGGGALPGQLLACMEAAINRSATTYSRYGSFTHKQVYIYGALDHSPTVLDRSYGLAWGIGGWLMTPVFASLEPARVAALRARIAAELTTTFASPHAATVSLAGALDLAAITKYAAQASGAKTLILPNG